MNLSDFETGVLSWICEGETNLLSFCFQRSIIDGMNIVFFCVFYLFMLISLIRKYHSNSNHHENNQKDRIMVVASICCFLTCIMYLGTVLYDFIDRDGEVDHLSWIIRGLTWTSFAVSLLTQNSKWILCLTSVWWICLCVLLSILNIEALMINHTIPLFDLIPWLVSFLLLHCAFRNYNYFNSARYRKKTMLEESLLCESEKETIIQPQNGLNQANFFNRFTFSWLNPLLSLGYEKLLVLQDIPSLPNEDKANTCYQKFVSTRDSLLRRSGSSSNISKNLLILTMSRAFLRENIYIAIYALVRTISAAVGPLLVYAFVSHASRKLSEDEYFYEGLTLLACLVFVKFLETVSERQWYFESKRSGMRMRSALVVAVYEKLLNLSSFGRKRHSNGEIVNYIAVDAYRMGEFLYWFHSGWCFVLQILLSVCVLFWVVGLSAIPGLVLLVIFGVFFNVPYAKKIKNCKSEVLKSQDERLRLTSEILNNIKIIKLQAWEDKFMNMIESIRDTEFKWLAQTQFTKAFGSFLYVSPSIIGAVVLIACYLFNTAPLNAATIFTVLATLKSVAEPVRFIPEAVSVIIQVKVSFDRLNSFLLDNQTKIGYQKKNFYVSKTGKCIEIEEGDFSWDEESMKPTLREINLVIKHGEKVAVCGPVGSGKSSLLHAILGEMPKVCGTVSYELQLFFSITHIIETDSCYIHII